MKKRIIRGMLVLTMISSLVACKKDNLQQQQALNNNVISEQNSEETSMPTKTAEDVLASLTLEQKVNQMLQPAIYMVNPDDMKKNNYGSLLAGGGGVCTVQEWREAIDDYQKAAMSSESEIPFVYGTDAVHGVNCLNGAVIFPHNIGIGSAGEEELTYQMGLAVADEMKQAKLLWNFSPCVATAMDPRWGRTYESYSSDIEIVKKLSVAYTNGLLDGGVIACPKHFLGDGNTTYGSGEAGMLIDRGNAELSEQQLNQLLDVYQKLVDAGAQTIMVSHSAVNGLKMHENKTLIQDTLKDKMGFKGFVVSDWESIHNTSGATLKEQTINAINAGIDMLMEPSSYEECKGYIIDAVNEGTITAERIDDAVLRILSVKMNIGLFDDPYGEKLETVEKEVNSQQYQDLAVKLVEKSLVLLKNENQTLPIKKGSTIYVTGPAADDTGVSCGGWTLSWEGQKDSDTRFVSYGKTILDGFMEIAKEYGLTIVTEEEEASKADVTVLCIGEKPYAEWNGDTADLSITGSMALEENKAAIERAKKLAKPTVTCIVAGRNTIIKEYQDNWDAIVLCYLPGSRADAVANVLSGKVDFTGKLSMPYYDSIEGINNQKCLYEVGYGLTIK